MYFRKKSIMSIILMAGTLSFSTSYAGLPNVYSIIVKNNIAQPNISYIIVTEIDYKSYSSGPFNTIFTSNSVLYKTNIAYNNYVNLDDAHGNDYFNGSITVGFIDHDGKIRNTPAAFSGNCTMSRSAKVLTFFVNNIYVFSDWKVYGGNVHIDYDNHGACDLNIEA